jgi:hypothetical protein
MQFGMTGLMPVPLQHWQTLLPRQIGQRLVVIDSRMLFARTPRSAGRHGRYPETS